MKNSKASYGRHDISDKVWAKLEPLLPGRKGLWGGVAQDNRRFINAVFWIFRTGAPMAQVFSTCAIADKNCIASPK